MVIDRIPTIGVRAGEIEIGLDQTLDAIIRICVQSITYIVRPKLEGSRVYGDEQLIQRAKDIIDRTDRIADALGHFARRKTRETDLGHMLVALQDKQLLQLLARMI